MELRPFVLNERPGRPWRRGTRGSEQALRQYDRVERHPGVCDRRVMKSAALLALADAAEALACLARAAAQDTSADSQDLVPLRDAARIAATSPRIVRDAIRRGDLPAYGGQRDRSIRLRDLRFWIESRRVPVRSGPDGRDIERRMARLARAGRKAGQWTTGSASPRGSLRRRSRPATAATRTRRRTGGTVKAKRIGPPLNASGRRSPNGGAYSSGRP